MSQKLRAVGVFVFSLLVPVEAFPQGQPEIFNQVLANGSKGPDEPFETGRSGGPGGSTADGLFDFANPSILSTTANTPGREVSRTAGNGGNGGSSDCCSGGLGGSGGYIETTTHFGVATIRTTEVGSPGFLIDVTNGSGGRGGDSGTTGSGGSGGNGAAPIIPSFSNVTVLSQSSTSSSSSQPWSIQTGSDMSAGVSLTLGGGNGGGGGTGIDGGAQGGTGGRSPEVNVGAVDSTLYTPFRLSATTAGDQSAAITISGTSGDGGRGGQNDTGTGGFGGNVFRPGEISAFLGALSLQTGGDQSTGILIESSGGTGGQGGSGATFGDGGQGGTGGGGGNISLSLYESNSISTTGQSAQGIAASSIGGTGGLSGDGSFVSNPGQPGSGAASGQVVLDLMSGSNEQHLPTGTVNTSGDKATGVSGISIGGYGGGAARDDGVLSFGVNGGSAGNGGDVTVRNALSVTTKGQSANALNAQSLGGGGGNGGSGFGLFYSGSGSGGAGGDGSTVTVTNSGALSTDNFDSSGIFAHSVGGAGGTGGAASGLVAIGGRAGPAASGGQVSVTNTGQIRTGGTPSSQAASDACAGCSYGIHAQSLGGGGGKAGSGDGWFAFGGTGGGGGDGDQVTVNNAGSISTVLDNSSAILAHSVGGGGGSGGGVISGGLAATASVGGTGGGGGSGGDVSVTSVPNLGTSDLEISTSGESSHGIAAQSVGGGGGNGGFSSATSVGISVPTVAVAVGGSGAQGGDGGSITMNTQGNSPLIARTTTTGDHSYGVLGQSIGGGGGTGGASIAVTADVGETGAGGVSVGVGGSGGKGGDGGMVEITSGGDITTSGVSAPALTAMSVGGGGGGGGLAVAADISIGSAGLDVGLGGKGGVAGDGGDVVLKDIAGAIIASGDHSKGIFAQSLGGGGGQGATSIAAGASTTGEVNVSVGGGGGAGGNAGTVTLNAVSDITTGDAQSGTGSHAPAIAAQSIGGGGGHGGLSLGLSGTTTSSASVGVSVGGSGSAGGDGSSVAAEWFSDILSTVGDHAPGLLAQSVGGGGGAGGTSVAGSVNLGSSVPINVAVGGSGGAAGNSVSASPPSAVVFTELVGSIETQGQFSSGIAAQSIGGGGGIGGLSFAGSVSAPDPVSAQASVGGNGAGGGSAGFVAVCNGRTGSSASVNCAGTPPTENQITTKGASSHGVLAQSIGGGGGHSGVDVNGDLAAQTSLGVGVGGTGGSAGSGGEVFVFSNGTIETTGQASNGILAQSSGGGGGASYATVTASGITTNSANVSVGGDGGDAAGSGAVSVISTSKITTSNSLSNGISAISAGGSGGTGGTVIAGSAITTNNAAVAVGGAGGGGATAGAVQVDWTGPSIATTGDQSVGIHAHSGGGSGGRGGMAINGDLWNTNDVAVTIGGSGGAGGTAGTASITTDGDISTSGRLAPGIAASSQGGNGGRGGASAATTGVSQRDVAVTLGGNGGSGGTANDVSVTSKGMIGTTGSQSQGIFAQSQGGNGGAGGWVAEGGLDAASGGSTTGSVSVDLGGAGGPGGRAGKVAVDNGATVTTGNFSAPGIFAQSIGGDGGHGGAVYSGQANLKTRSTVDVAVNVGGSGGDGGTGSAVAVTNKGAVTTALSDSDAIFAQSVGGSGGKGGASYNVLLNLAAQSDNSADFQVTVGGEGGTGATGGAVNVSNSDSLSTSGARSAGIYAQSVGGNGGKGGAAGNILANVSGSDSEGGSSQTNNVQVDIAVGGKGGTGAHASTVTISNTAGAAITTTGATSYGIFGQSVGGGGGDGGVASGYNLDIAGTCSLAFATTFSYNCKNSEEESSTTTFASNVDVGGNGGAAGDGADVTINNDAQVATLAEYSHAIVGQSVGGGGGTGGDGTAGLDAFTSNEIANDIAAIIADATTDPIELLTTFTNFDLSIGGKGGSSGTGGLVLVTNSGEALTSSVGSHGILAQSVGGGGGTGGAGASSPLHSLSIGGSGDGGGDAGEVRVVGESGSAISTEGDASYGILAQSVGGGGGATGSRSSPIIGQGIQATLGLLIGGADGVSGDGDFVFITNNGTISTTGRASIGIFGQSIGGGGGLAIDGLDGATGTVTVKGAGAKEGTTAASGSGGPVDITHAGTITTGPTTSTSLSDAAHGVFAQSVGGGGGYGGALIMGGPTAQFGTQVSSGNGPNGIGADITTEVTGDIKTFGGSSVGVFAQSVGGGGGVAGNTDNTSETGAVVGSAGGVGDAGVVSVDIAGATVSTSGSYAHGVFAQSAGGAPSSPSNPATVGVSVNSSGANSPGKIITTGDGAAAIVAQSSGSSSGIITVSIDAASEVLSTQLPVSGSGGLGTTIWVLGGATGNSIKNSGTIGNVNNTTGLTAIHYDGSAGLTVDNSGTVVGNFTKGAASDNLSIAHVPAQQSGPSFETRGLTEVINRQGGTLVMDGLSTFDQITNYGFIDIAGQAGPGALMHQGHLLKNESTGTIALDLFATSPVSAANDQLISSGLVYFALGSTLSLSTSNIFQPKIGSMFDLVVGQGLIFETELSDDFDLFDYISAPFLNRREWALSLFSDKSPNSGLLSSTETLRLSFTAPVPIPGSVILYGTVLFIGGWHLRHRRRVASKAGMPPQKCPTKRGGLPCGHCQVVEGTPSL